MSTDLQRIFYQRSDYGSLYVFEVRCHTYYIIIILVLHLRLSCKTVAKAHAAEFIICEFEKVQF